MNVLALGRLLDNHMLVGPHISIELIRDAQEMLHRTLDRSFDETQWMLEQMTVHGSLTFARRAARHLAGAALGEAIEALRDIPDSADKGFLLELPLFIIERDR